MELQQAAVTFTLCVAMVLVQASPAIAQPTVPGSLASIDFGVALCTDSKSIQPVDSTVRAAVVRAVTPAAEGKTVGYRVVPCEGVLADSSCFAQEKVLVCRVSVIERNLRAAAWAALAYERSGSGAYDAFRTQVPRWNVEAFRYADGVRPEPEFDKAAEQLRNVYRRYQGADATTAALAVGKTELLFIAIVDYTLATLIGHELSHVNGERCPLSERADVENSGLVSRLTALHQTGELFCPRNPSPEEVRADVCGMRHIHRVGKSFASRNVDVETMLVARRLSADIIAFKTIFGWRPRPGAPLGSYGFLELKQYLFEPMRVLAFGTELGAKSAGEPAVCGEAASLVVHGTQELFKRCKDAKGIVADDILVLLPKKVEASWNGAPWTSSSFACDEK